MLGKIRTTVLENGCRVVTSEMPGVESFAIAFDAGVGSRHENRAHAGWSHFLEHMLFKGSVKRPSTRALSQPVEGRGGLMNAYTALERTCFFGAVPYDAAPILADVLGDMYVSPLFAQKEIERERKVVLEEIKMYHDDDSSFALELGQDALWGGHPLGRPVLGTEKSLAAADSETIRAFHRASYRARGTIVAAAGRLEHEKVVDMVRARVAELPPGPAPRAKPASAAPAPKPLAFERRETQQVQVALCFRAIPYDDPRAPAAAVLAQILGRGMTSRLFMSLRERRGMAYSVVVEPSYSPDGGSFSVLAGVDPRRSVAAVALCAKELRRIAAENAGKAEFSRAVKFLAGVRRMHGETSSQQLSWILEKTRMAGRVETPEEYIRKIMAVTPDDVRGVAADIFRPDATALSLVMPRELPETPEKHLDAVLQAL